MADLHQSIDAATVFCATRQVILPAIEQLVVGSIERLQRVDDAVNALISPDPRRREFFGHERIVTTLYGTVKPDPSALEFAGVVACLGAIADAIRAKLNPGPADISAVMGDIGEQLDESITGIAIREEGPPPLDLSRTDFADRFEELIDSYKSLLVLNWQQKSSARSQLKLVIEDVLDFGLPRIYDKPLYEQKSFALFEHVYENYPKRDAGTYGTAAATWFPGECADGTGQRKRACRPDAVPRAL